MKTSSDTNSNKLISFKWRTKILIALLLVLFLLLGASFERTTERYAYKFIDFIWSAKSQSECSESQLLKVQTRRRQPIRSNDLIETSDDWEVIEKEYAFCPKNTALLLIDVWETETLKNDVVKAEHNRITNDVIIPIVDKVRNINGIVVHSPNGSPMYPNIYDNNTDTNLNWTNVLPRKLQTIILFWKLRSSGIRTLIYAGFSTNLCLYDRPHGIFFTKLFDDYFTRLLLRDATATWEFSSEQPTVTKNFIKFLEWHHLPSFLGSEFLESS